MVMTVPFGHDVPVEFDRKQNRAAGEEREAQQIAANGTIVIHNRAASAKAAP
jgi:hypothetical protein